MKRDALSKEVVESGLTLRRPSAPEVTPQKKLILARLDSSGGYFKDNEGCPWYFDIEERTWRDLRDRDVHPMRLQDMPQLETPGRTFDDLEVAVAHILGVCWRDRLEVQRKVMEGYEPTTPEDIKDLEDYKALHKLYEELIAALERFEREGLNPKERDELRTTIADLFTRIELPEEDDTASTQHK